MRGKRATSMQICEKCEHHEKKNTIKRLKFDKELEHTVSEIIGHRIRCTYPRVIDVEYLILEQTNDRLP